MFNNHQLKCAYYASAVAIVLNLILPLIAGKFATEEEIMPKNGAGSLSVKGQIMHMLVHHNQVPFSSSVLILTITFLSVLIGYKLQERTKK